LYLGRIPYWMTKRVEVLGQKSRSPDTLQNNYRKGWLVQEEKIYDFVIKLAGRVSAKNEAEAEKKINAHLDDLGEIDSLKHDLSWPDASWEMEYELK
jgi:hypothetical protein